MDRDLEELNDCRRILCKQADRNNSQTKVGKLRLSIQMRSIRQQYKQG
jgi:hypothetical protein